MALPPDVEAVMNAAYEILSDTVDGMAAGGHDPRAVIGAMGRLFVQLSREELNHLERRELFSALLGAALN